MLKLIRDNQKKVLAFFGVFLMIAFVGSFGKNSPSNTSDVEAGTIGKTKIYSSELISARNELRAADDNMVVRAEDMENRQPRITIVDYLMGPGMYGQPGPAGVLRKNPEMMVLLRHEAEQAGIHAGADQLNTYMRFYKGPPTDPDARTACEACVSDLLVIRDRFWQMRNRFKIPQPRIDQEIAYGRQKLQFNLVQIRTDEYLQATTRPSDDELKKQFDAFSTVEPGKPDPDKNPFGFGYRFPVRAQFQYLTVADDAVEKAVAAKKSDYDWDVAARKYYYSHPDQYPATGVVGPTVPGAAPPVRPYELVKDAALHAIRDPLVKALSEQTKNYISTTMNTDWQKSTKPAASSSVGVSYASPDYLQKLAEAVEASPIFGVHATVGSTGDYLTYDQIEKLPVVGSSAVRSFVKDAATQYTAAVDGKSPDAATTMTKPSGPLTLDTPATTGPSVETTAFVRLSSVLPSEPPKNFTAVASAIEKDLRTAAAYKSAKAEADLLLVAAGNGTLPAVALERKHGIVSTKPLTGNTYADDLDIVQPPLDAGVSPFLKQAFTALEKYDPINAPHPAVLIEMPSQPRIFVAQLSTLSADWNADRFYGDVMEIRHDLADAGDQMLARKWYAPDAITKRTGFVPKKTRQDQTAE